MAKYEILDKNNNVINTIEADELFCSANFPYFRLVPDPIPMIPAIRILSHLAFMNRLTDNELAAILTAAKSNVAVEVWLRKFDAAQEINLDDTNTINGLQGLETAGILATGRASQILA